jgi:hypothetical protein
VTVVAYSKFVKKYKKKNIGTMIKLRAEIA